MKKTILALLLVSPIAYAQEYVTVKAVYPNYVAAEFPRQECRTVPVVTQQFEERRNLHGNVPGAILGAVVGSQFGKGTGRDVAIVAGAITGYEWAQPTRTYSTQSIQYVQQCSVVYAREMVINGYRVTARFPDGRDTVVVLPFEPRIGEELRIIR
jgi:uncharacterized protein YcfJ